MALLAAQALPGGAGRSGAGEAPAQRGATGWASCRKMCGTL